MFGLNAGLLLMAIFLAAFGLVVLGMKLGKRQLTWWRRRKNVPTMEQAVELALVAQVDHERHLAASGVHYWTQQRERAVLQRIEKLTGQRANPTIAGFVRQRLLQIEVVNLSPHKHRVR